MSRLILSLAITAALVTACSGQGRAVRAAAPAQEAVAALEITDLGSGGLDLGMIDPGARSARSTSGSGAAIGAHVGTDAFITP